MSNALNPRSKVLRVMPILNNVNKMKSLSCFFNENDLHYARKSYCLSKDITTFLSFKRIKKGQRKDQNKT